jgi:hypothetical protein
LQVSSQLKFQGDLHLKIGELQNGMKRVEVEAEVVDKGNPRQVQSRFGTKLQRRRRGSAEETGTIKQPVE